MKRLFPWRLGLKGLDELELDLIAQTELWREKAAFQYVTLEN